MRKNIQHIQINSEAKNQKLENTTNENFQTAEGIEVKATYSKEDIADLRTSGFWSWFCTKSSWTIYYNVCAKTLDNSSICRIFNS